MSGLYIDKIIVSEFGLSFYYILGLYIDKTIVGEFGLSLYYIVIFKAFKIRVYYTGMST